MIAADHRLHAAATAHGNAVLRLIDILKAARAVQHTAPVGARITTAVAVLDPTGSASVAPTRLRLAAHVHDAITRLDLATADFDRLAAALEEDVELHTDPRARRRTLAPAELAEELAA